MYFSIITDSKNTILKIAAIFVISHGGFLGANKYELNIF